MQTSHFAMETKTGEKGTVAAFDKQIIINRVIEDITLIAVDTSSTDFTPNRNSLKVEDNYPTTVTEGSI